MLISCGCLEAPSPKSVKNNTQPYGIPTKFSVRLPFVDFGRLLFIPMPDAEIIARIRLLRTCNIGPMTCFFDRYENVVKASAAVLEPALAGLMQRQFGNQVTRCMTFYSTPFAEEVLTNPIFIFIASPPRNSRDKL